jgi:hypothetical protein
MPLMKLEKSRWQTYFDTLSRVLVGQSVELEVAALDLGDQVEAKWLLLLGVDYDPRNDLIEIAFDGVDHLIRRPREVFIDDDGSVGLSSLMDRRRRGPPTHCAVSRAVDTARRCRSMFAATQPALHLKKPRDASFTSWT